MEFRMAFCRRGVFLFILICFTTLFSAPPSGFTSYIGSADSCSDSLIAAKFPGTVVRGCASIESTWYVLHLDQKGPEGSVSLVLSTIRRDTVHILFSRKDGLLFMGPRMAPQFIVGDINGNRAPDILCMVESGESGRSEVNSTREIIPVFDCRKAGNPLPMGTDDYGWGDNGQYGTGQRTSIAIRSAPQMEPSLFLVSQEYTFPGDRPISQKIRRIHVRKSELSFESSIRYRDLLTFVAEEAPDCGSLQLFGYSSF